MTSTRITGGILVLLLVSILSFEAAGMGISSYLNNTTYSHVSYLSMILEATAIGVIAIVLVVTLISLFSNTSSSVKTRKLAQKISEDLTEKHKTANQSLMKLHEHEKTASGLISKLQQRYEILDQLQSAAEEKAENLENITERLQSHERDLQQASDSIGKRLNQVQNYWDEQLEETVDTVQRIRSSLGASLTRVDNSMERLKEQEIMAQQFTKKLVKNYEEQAAAQKENNHISTHVRKTLEATLNESSQLLQHLQKYHQDAENAFKKFSTTMEDYEVQSYEQFENIFASTDLARKELQAGLEDSKQVVEKLKARDKEAQELSEKVTKQLETLELNRVEIMTKTLEETSELCSDLKQGMSETQDVLYGLKAINSGEKQDIEEITTNKEIDVEATADNVEELKTPIKSTEAHDTEEENKLISFFSRR